MLGTVGNADQYISSSMLGTVDNTGWYISSSMLGTLDNTGQYISAPCWEQWTILASGAKRSDRGGAYSGAPALHPYGIVSITS